MREVLISIQPKWCEKIAHIIGYKAGKPIYEKSVEVRKTRPKIETPFKVYIYCTQAKDVLAINDKLPYLMKKADVDRYNADTIRNGKVIGEFVCDHIGYVRNYGDMVDSYDCIASCLSAHEIIEYAKDKNGNFVHTYGWHISELKIYDEPKGLHHFFKPCGDCEKKGTKKCTEELTDCRAKVITRPPQSWCYVEGGER